MKSYGYFFNFKVTVFDKGYSVDFAYHNGKTTIFGIYDEEGTPPIKEDSEEYEKIIGEVKNKASEYADADALIDEIRS